MNNDSQLKKDLLEKLTREFPDLSFNSVELVNHGDDHAVLILDKKRIVRFPKNAQYQESFKQELKLLQTLIEKGLPVPFYDYVASNSHFGSYRFIDGTELRLETFNTLSQTSLEALIKDIAHFLSGLHSIPLDTIEISEHKERWDSDEIWKYTDRYFNERRKIIENHVSSSLLAELDQFFNNLKEMKSSVRRIIHDDLSDDHILVKPDGTLAGIIDFGDANIGDPAFDFFYFWNYEDSLAHKVYKNYKFKDDTELLNRSYWHFVRFLADELFKAYRDNKNERALSITKKIEEALPKLPQLN